MRVTGGRLAGRRLRAPSGRGTRPSADRLREALFARLGDLTGATVLDLFAGSGSLGIEALSRGAAHCTFVERSGTASSVLRANLASLGLEACARVVRGDVRRVLRRMGGRGERFDLVLLDPPYGGGDTRPALEALAGAGILAAGATVVLEASSREELGTVPGLAVLDRRRQGDTLVTRFVVGAGPEQRGGGMATGRIGLFAASFDPLTNGHLDVVSRARRLFDEVVVAVGRNVAKQGSFTFEERLEMLEAVLDGQPGVRIACFDGLVVHYAREIGATALIRGLRAMSDFEYEFEMALMNRHLHRDLDTIFMMTDQKYLYVSSSRLKELARLGADIEEWVPPIVAKRLREKVSQR